MRHYKKKKKKVNNEIADRKFFKKFGIIIMTETAVSIKKNLP